MRIRVGDQCINAVTGTLGLGLRLEVVISGFAEVPEFQNGVAGWWSVGRDERSPTGSATESIGPSGNTCRRTVSVDGVASDQDVVATRTSIASGEHDIAGQLALEVGVVLHYLSLPEVPWLVEICPGKCVYSWRSVKNWKSVRDANDVTARAAGRSVSGWSRLWATPELEDVALCEKGRVLPKTLRALAPRRVVIHRKA